MKVITKMIQIKSCGENDVNDVTSQTAGLVRESGPKDGIITVFIVGSTAAITTIENGLGSDMIFQKCYPVLHQQILDINTMILGNMEMDAPMLRPL